ncbi:MAG: M56 family metallopeptidase [Gemmatimonas sp.]
MLAHMSYALFEQGRTILIDAAWRGAVLLAAAFAVTWLLRKAPASLRHAVWTGAVAMQLFLPMFALWGPRWEVPISGVASKALPIASFQQTMAEQTNARRFANSRLDAQGKVERDQRQLNTRSAQSTTVPTEFGTSQMSLRARVLVAIWLIGMLLVVLRLVLGAVFTARLARRANIVSDPDWLVATQQLAAKLGVHRPIRLLQTDALAVPLTWGVVYPVVMLPADAGEWRAARRNMVLVHELSHISRVDALSQLVAQLALALFWFNPLLWVANTRMRTERELACDDAVLRQGTKASHYADELLAMVQRSPLSGVRVVRPAFAALAMANRTDLEIRLRAMLSVDRTQRTQSQMYAWFGGITGCLLVTPVVTMDLYRSALPCTRCEIRSSLVATLSDPSPTLRLQKFSQAKRGANGQFYVSRVGRKSQIAIYDASGKFLRAVSGQGNGNGELRAQMRLHELGVADTLLVLDEEQNLLLYAPNGDYVRRVKLPVEGWALIMLRDGRFVAQANIEGNQRSGLSFHLLTANGKLVRSFGPLLASDGSFNQAAVSRRLSLGNNGEIISNYPDRYRIEQWDTAGHLIRVTEPKTDWFPSQDPEQPHFQAGRAFFDGTVYWTQSGISRLMPPSNALRYSTGNTKETSRKQELLPTSKMLTRVQAVDPATGLILASSDILHVSSGAAGAGWMYKRYEDEAQVTRIDILRNVLVEAPAVRK